MEKFPSDWYSQIKPLVNQLLGGKVDQLEIKAELDSYIDQVKLILEHDVLWRLV
jgi:hypothetical protein